MRLLSLHYYFVSNTTSSFSTSITTTTTCSLSLGAILASGAIATTAPITYTITTEIEFQGKTKCAFCQTLIAYL